jgi:uncharacterized protein DUF5988
MDDTLTTGQAGTPTDNDAEFVTAVLVGAPETFPRDAERLRVRFSTKRLKVPHYGGYEHFERESDTPAGDCEMIYSWVGRTRVAE